MESGSVSIFGFMLNLFLAAILSLILARIYVKYGTALSNRRMFAKNFMLITMATILIITIVKSSLALSLGLVGALSIVRFRSAIKEPEELTYLFLAIAIGLGFGANQRLITIVTFAIIWGIIFLRKHSQPLDYNQNLYLTVASRNIQMVPLKQIVNTLGEYCLTVNMKRFDESEEALEASFLIEFKDLEQLHVAKTELRKLDKSMKITFLDNRGIL